MCEGPSRISGPIPPDPTLFPEYYKRPFSARGRLEGNAQKLYLTSGPLDPVPNPYPALGSAHQAQPAPRIRPSGKDFLEKGQKGTLSLLLQLQGLCLDKGMPVKRKEAKDYEKENVRRIKEIQRKCKEKERAQEHSQPKPVKALWKSQKYENVESKVKAKLQETSPPPNPEAVNFLRAYSRCGSGIKPCRPLSPRPVRAKAGADTETPEAQGAETKKSCGGGAVSGEVPQGLAKFLLCQGFCCISWPDEHPTCFSSALKIHQCRWRAGALTSSGTTPAVPSGPLCAAPSPCRRWPSCWSRGSGSRRNTTPSKRATSPSTCWRGRSCGASRWRSGCETCQTPTRRPDTP
uniref:Enkurin domain containing 1 n=1 Tax=Cyanistes caeruleus TaxID=156563 RepID=A0A8C0UIC5_CYACU